MSMHSIADQLASAPGSPCMFRGRRATEGTHPVNKKLMAVTTGAATLTLALAGCSSSSNDKVDKYAKSVCDQVQPQLLHLVLGGELIDLEHITFKDLDKVDIVGLFPNYASAHAAWRAKAQQTVDNAQMRYFIVHLHRLLDPSNDPRAHACVRAFRRPR